MGFAALGFLRVKRLSAGLIPAKVKRLLCPKSQARGKSGLLR